jgi:MFS family permease
MHVVAAAWLMTSLTSSAALVALLQTANAAPAFLFGLPAGALADVLDRRRIVLVSQTWQLLVAAALGVLTLGHVTTPAVLLALTFVLAAGSAMGLPAFGALTTEVVPPARAVAVGHVAELGGGHCLASSRTGAWRTLGCVIRSR